MPLWIFYKHWPADNGNHGNQYADKWLPWQPRLYTHSYSPMWPKMKYYHIPILNFGECSSNVGAYCAPMRREVWLPVPAAILDMVTSVPPSFMTSFPARSSSWISSHFPWICFPRWRTGNDVIQDGGPEVTSSKMAARTRSHASCLIGAQKSSPYGKKRELPSHIWR